MVPGPVVLRYLSTYYVNSSRATPPPKKNTQINPYTNLREKHDGAWSCCGRGGAQP